jgi:hypothetical protein
MNFETIKAADELALQHNLSREIYDYYEDKTAKVIRVKVAIYSEGRKDVDYYFITGENHAIALAAAKALATFRFMGQDIPKQEEAITPTQTEEVSNEKESSKEAEVPQKKGRPKKEKVAKEEKKLASTPYDRDNPTHRQFLATFLKKNYSKWDTREGLKEFSMSLKGKDFLYENGEIVPTFKQELDAFFS